MKYAERKEAYAEVRELLTL